MLVALSGMTGLDEEAAQFARASPMSYEWESDSSGPMREASAAERYLRDQSTTSLAPALKVFMLHRFRCAFEAATWAKDSPVQVRAADGYRVVWGQLENSRDPVVRSVADEIDREEYVYIETKAHPRTFNRTPR